MVAIVGWRLDNDKIILSISDEKMDFDVELPIEMYKELIQEGPPSEETQIRELIDKIYAIKKNRVLAIDKILAGDEALRNAVKKVIKGIGAARTELKAANDKHDINKWKAVLTSFDTELRAMEKEKKILQEYRHLVKLTYQEEGNLRVKLLRKQT